MKKILTPCIAFALAIMCSVSAFAMEVPTDAVVQNLNGVQQYLKTYTVAPDVDPQALIESPFDYDGFTYSFATIVKNDNLFEDETTRTETITVETKKKDLSVVLSALSPSMVYDDGQYSGQLYLDHTTIETVAAGYSTQSYTVSEVKEIGNLDSNDMAYIPATTVKDGKTIQLSAVDWQVQGTALVDDVLVPSQYKAVATYSGKAYYNAPTGYITTAKYNGEVSCKEVQSVTYTLTYVGETTPKDSAASRIADKVVAFVKGHLLLILVVLGAILIAVTVGCVIRKKRMAINGGIPVDSEQQFNENDEEPEDAEHEI